MSGTSTDAVDGVLADNKLNIIASDSLSIPDDLQQILLDLNQASYDELSKSAIAANRLVDIYSKVTHNLLHKSGLQAKDILAIGAHGQTIRHVPEQSYTIQLNAPARLVEQTGIAVIADFRSRDIAAGGQGAPLVPAFHAALFGQGQKRAVLNLGGIANLTVLADEVTGFDTGPANMLMDAWAQKTLGQAFDENGGLAASGNHNLKLLANLLAEPWFAIKPPKSTGRDLFSLNWLENIICDTDLHISNADIQATLLELSVISIKQAINNYAGVVDEVIVCGGGVQNPVFMHRLKSVLTCQISTSDMYGVPAQYMEALAFAWLAKANLDGVTACLPAVTGAKHPSIAGCIYPV